MIRDTWNDARFALRGFRKNPGFAVAAMLVLGLGVGAVTLMFSTLNAVVLRPLPFYQPDRLVWMWATSEQQPTNSISWMNYFDYREQADGFASLAAFLVFTPPAVLTGSAEPQRVVSNYVTANLFATLGVSPLLGRGFVEEDELAGAERVVVVGHGLWQRLAGGATTILGTALTLDGDPYEVVGVMPPRFDYPGGVDLWFPMKRNAFYAEGRGNNNFNAVGRLGAGVPIERAQNQIDVIAGQLQARYPETNEGWSATLVPLHERYFANARSALVLLMGIVVGVLLIACANVASLSMARATTRGTELAVRSSLGAGRGRLLRQLLTEHLLLALAGGGVGLAFAAVGTRMVRAFGPASLPRLDTIGIDGTVLGVTLGITIATALLFGVVPSVRGTRFSLAGTLRQGGRGTGASNTPYRSTLVVAQVAMSLMLLMASGLLVRSFINLQGVDPGFRTDGVLVAELQLPGDRFATDEQIMQGWDEVTGRIEALPGVSAVGAIDQAPIRTGGTYNNVFAQGREPASQSDYVPAQRRFVTEGYFRSLGIRLDEGRGFEPTDRAGAASVTVINETLAQQLWPGDSPIGQMLVWPPVPMEVVGVVSDTRDFGAAAPVRPMFFLPLRQRGGLTAMRLMIQTAGDPLQLVGAVREAAWAVDKNIPVSGVESMEGRVSASLAQPRFRMLLVGVFAMTALVLASLGVYATLAFFVRARVYELAVRIAVGATAVDILRLVLRNGLVLVGLGIVVGLAGAVALMRVLRQFLFEVAPTDALTMVAVTGGLLVIALCACLVPARRAMRVDPREALAAQ
jgi:putative ABC transport system permease protein